MVKWQVLTRNENLSSVKTEKKADWKILAKNCWNITACLIKLHKQAEEESEK